MALRDHLRICVVDDMSTSRGLLAQALEELGLNDVRASNGGKAAMQELARRPAHLVISDYHMPDMSGLDLLRQLRSGEKTKDIGFILVSGNANQQVIDQGVKLGLNNYLAKPFQKGQLLQSIEAVVGRI